MPAFAVAKCRFPRRILVENVPESLELVRRWCLSAADAKPDQLSRPTMIQ